MTFLGTSPGVASRVSVNNRRVALQFVEEIDHQPHRPARARQPGDLSFTRLAKVDAREAAAACARAKKRDANGIEIHLRPGEAVAVNVRRSRPCDEPLHAGQVQGCTR